MSQKDPIQQDHERFRYLTNDRAHMPAGYTAPFDFKPTRTLISERLALLKGGTALENFVAKQ